MNAANLPQANAHLPGRGLVNSLRDLSDEETLPEEPRPEEIVEETQAEETRSDRSHGDWALPTPPTPATTEGVRDNPFGSVAPKGAQGQSLAMEGEGVQWSEAGAGFLALILLVSLVLIWFLRRGR